MEGVGTGDAPKRRTISPRNGEVATAKEGLRFRVVLAGKVYEGAK